jgi:hypothetical protein
MQLPKLPGDETPAKKRNAKKASASLRDLSPREDARGGGNGILRNEPPLPIPPPGFIISGAGDKQDGQA